MDPFLFIAHKILHLIQVLERGKSPSTLRGMVAAIKAARVGPWKLAEDFCDLIAQFLKGPCRVTHYHIRSGIL